MGCVSTDLQVVLTQIGAKGQRLCREEDVRSPRISVKAFGEDVWVVSLIIFRKKRRIKTKESVDTEEKICKMNGKEGKTNGLFHCGYAFL